LIGLIRIDLHGLVPNLNSKLLAQQAAFSDIYDNRRQRSTDGDNSRRAVLFQWEVGGELVDFLRVRNFETFQHYSKRRPPWVKLYKDLWHDPEFIHLDSVVKLCIIGCFTLASETDNRIPENRKWIQKRLGLVRPPDITALLASGFIERIPQDGAKTVQGSSRVATGLLQGCYRVATKIAQAGDDSKEVTGNLLATR